MNLESLRQLSPAELSARAMIACCGWRWLRCRYGERPCTFQPPLDFSRVEVTS